MKKLIVKILAISIITLIAFIVLSSKLELGKYDSFEEALEKGLPTKTKEVIFTENVDNFTVVLYTIAVSESAKEKLSNSNFDFTCVAFLKGNDVDGWEIDVSNKLEHYDDKDMTVYTHNSDFSRDGNGLNDMHVVFGEITNNKIMIIETITNTNNDKFKVATIFINKGKRYYFQAGEVSLVRGVSKEGKVIFQREV